ncbi:TadE/TadG family type IV pilus assembly protein [Pseudomonas putida]
MMGPGLLRDERGITTTETAFLLPVILIALMMFFELARLALVIVIGNLALDSALQSMRQQSELRLDAETQVAAQVQERMVSAAYGYLDSAVLQVQVTTYSSLQAFGEGEQHGEDDDDNDSPILSVQVELTQDWITALPALLNLSDSFTYTYRQVVGNLFEPVIRT